MNEKCQWNQLGFSSYWSCLLDFLHKTAAGNLKSAGEFIVAHNIIIIYLFLLAAGKEKLLSVISVFPREKELGTFMELCSSEDVE